jgi:histidine decarboxylase
MNLGRRIDNRLQGSIGSNGVSPFALEAVVEGAIGPFPGHCMGYMNAGASGHGYINVMKLAVAKVNAARLDANMEQIYSEIYSYDRCEVDGAYLGQTNGLTATSFSGMNGAIWGYHLAKAPGIAGRTLSPMFTDLPRDTDSPIRPVPVPVYPIGPILEAGERLFGRVDREGATHHDRRRFPCLPGGHIISANKDAGSHGPVYVWSAIALGTVEDRERDANLFMEDAGVTPAQLTSANGAGEHAIRPDALEMEELMMEKLRRIARAMVLWGEDRRTPLTAIYAGAKYIYAGPREWGLSLTCIPYLLLARDVIPNGGAPADLLQLTFDEWEAKLGLPPLPPAPKPEGSGSIGC